jgi:DNA-binding Lrp family transcriptional regulator
MAHLLGVVPEIPGLTRQEILVLAALNRRPLGLVSARAVARSAGISPTTASRALVKLHEEGYVTKRTEKVVEGKVVERQVWRVARSPGPWQKVAARVRKTVLPATKKAPVTGRRLPSRFGHVFWNADLQKIDLKRDATYVAGRILASNDTQALAWMARALPTRAIVKASQVRGMTQENRALARNLARKS